MKHLLTVIGVLVAWSTIGATHVQAHAFAPALLEMTAVEQASVEMTAIEKTTGVEGVYDVTWKQPAVRTAGSELRPLLPADCQQVDGAVASTSGVAAVATWRVACSSPLVGSQIEVAGIAASQADVLVRLVLADGRSIRHVLTAEQPAFEVPERDSAVTVAAAYGRLGVEHILGGFDHLLFVLALMLLVGGGRRLLVTVTAFTIGHSVTLALASLGVVHVPSAPVEALIALSIVCLAAELVQAVRGRDRTPMQRWPWAVAASFGLLHGLGFAGALSEIGLPQGEIPAALFAFNLGIELGQLAFVAVALAVIQVGRWLLSTVGKSRPILAHRALGSGRLRLATAYTIGTLSAFWLIERVAGVAGTFAALATG